MPLRVISGTAGGLPLRTPKRHALRPTQDRIRQVIFSSLAEVVPGARVLDLYAGTGSFGVEALSRGAVSALFVEENGEAVECIRHNLSFCKLQGIVRQQDVKQALGDKQLGVFDLIFSDPPYDKRKVPLKMDATLPGIHNYLAPNGFLILEHFAGQSLELPCSWKMFRQKDYGETGLTFLQLSH